MAQKFLCLKSSDYMNKEKEYLIRESDGKTSWQKQREGEREWERERESAILNGDVNKFFSFAFFFLNSQKQKRLSLRKQSACFFL